MGTLLHCWVSTSEVLHVRRYHRHSPPPNLNCRFLCRTMVRCYFVRNLLCLCWKLHVPKNVLQTIFWWGVFSDSQVASAVHKKQVHRHTYQLVAFSPGLAIPHNLCVHCVHTVRNRQQTSVGTWFSFVVTAAANPERPCSIKIF